VDFCGSELCESVFDRPVPRIASSTSTVLRQRLCSIYTVSILDQYGCRHRCVAESDVPERVRSAALQHCSTDAGSVYTSRSRSLCALHSDQQESSKKCVSERRESEIPIIRGGVRILFLHARKERQPNHPIARLSHLDSCDTDSKAHGTWITRPSSPIHIAQFSQNRVRRCRIPPADVLP
jgi:hypothetical protein